MSNPIDRQAAIDALIRAKEPINNGDGTLTITPLTDAVIRKVLNELPSVQEQKGRWIKLYDHNWKCSECGAWWKSDENEINEEFQFCPTCGAHMEGAEDEL